MHLLQAKATVERRDTYGLLGVLRALGPEALPSSHQLLRRDAAVVIGIELFKMLGQARKGLRKLLSREADAVGIGSVDF